MKTGIIVAMGKEMDLLLPLLTDAAEETVDGIMFHTGRIGSREIVAMQCGIGKVNAAIGALTLINRYSPDLVVNTGVAGGAGNAAGILDVVVADRVAYHDVWCGPGTEPGDAAGCPRFFTTAPTVLALPCLDRSGVRVGLIASGDIFVSRPDEVERIKTLYPDALAVDMESAAIAQVCYLRQVPFACIRVISDTPGAAENISQYENFWDDAPRHTFALLRDILAT
ncbi:MAG: 5'-methylthioadenosine/adenosylhomocysteine nucleosidase [Pseudoflavonifractor sp.]|nr:5'-methylthioadenosine/adenosylhomocysteine nucleosidase [Pseudoflavonifractor sp.]